MFDNHDHTPDPRPDVLRSEQLADALQVLVLHLDRVRFTLRQQVKDADDARLALERAVGIVKPNGQPRTGVPMRNLGRLLETALLAIFVLLLVVLIALAAPE